MVRGQPRRPRRATLKAQAVRLHLVRRPDAHILKRCAEPIVREGLHLPDHQFDSRGLGVGISRSSSPLAPRMW